MELYNNAMKNNSKEMLSFYSLCLLSNSSVRAVFNIINPFVPNAPFFYSLKTSGGSEQIKQFNGKNFCICENKALNKTKSKQMIY